MTTQSKTRLIVTDFISYVVLSFAIGLVTSLALAGAVLLLAGHTQTAQEIQPATSHGMPPATPPLTAAALAPARSHTLA